MGTIPSLVDRFARFIAWLCAVIGVYAAVFPWARPLVAAAQRRVRCLGERFARLAARVSAGAPCARCKGAAPRPDTVRRLPPVPPPATPWLMHAVAAAFHCAAALNRLLDDPAMAELVAAAPQAGTILRPLCRMLGVKRPAYLRAARRAPAQAEAGRDFAPNPSPAPQAREQDAGLPPPPLPPPARSKAEQEALAHARRPGGMVFDGTGFRWS